MGFEGSVRSVRTVDVRFPTSRTLTGSDAMNPEPDYSAAYVVIETDRNDSAAGHGFVFTIGRGNDVQLSAIEALAPQIVGRALTDCLSDMGNTARRLVHDSQLRWLGPEKGVIHMAIGAVLNALWDLRARLEGRPLWQLLGRMSPDEIVSLVDFRYLSDALTQRDARDLLLEAESGRASREADLISEGYPAYTTSPGWLGLPDERLAELTRKAVEDGFGMVKLKVGADLADDHRRLKIVREIVGADVRVAIDANQRWDVPVAIEWINELARYDLWWVEEPTFPDDVLGHAEIARQIAPVRVATGEHVANRVVFKQLLQATATSFVQLDATRVAGVNENIAIVLLAAKFGVPVCPHAGGVGLCELVQHLAMFDFVAVSGDLTGRAIEYVDHLHAHCVDPVDLAGGRYRAPTRSGMSAELLPKTLANHRFPDGPVWNDNDQH